MSTSASQAAARSVAARFACLLVVAGVACTSNSSDLTTSNIEAQYVVTLNDDPNSMTEGKGPTNTTLEAFLTDATPGGGPANKVNLSGGDTLSVTTDKSDNVSLPHVDDGHYLATIPQLDRVTFTFHLKRSSGTSDSPLTLPDHLAMTASPTAGQAFPASGTVHFAWSNQAHGGKLTLHSGHHVCNGITLTNDFIDQQFPDSGTLDAPLSSFYGAGAPASGDCIDLAIERAVTGYADMALGPGSSVTGVRTDRFTIKVQ